VKNVRHRSNLVELLPLGNFVKYVKFDDSFVFTNIRLAPLKNTLGMKNICVMKFDKVSYHDKLIDSH
jgi:hypothetical protein